MVIVPKRRINLGPIDPKTARDIFIQSALVDGDFDCDLASDMNFFRHNEMLLEEARKLQDKLRRPDLLRPETARYEFYQARIPDEVYDKRTLEKWLKEGSKFDGKTSSLFMTLALCGRD